MRVTLYTFLFTTKQARKVNTLFIIEPEVKSSVKQVRLTQSCKTK